MMPLHAVMMRHAGHIWIDSLWVRESSAAERCEEMERIQTAFRHDTGVWVIPITLQDGEIPEAAALPEAESSAEENPTQDSLAQRIRKIFQGEPSRAFRVIEIANILGKGASIHSVGGAILRLADDDVKFLHRVSRGKYKLHRSIADEPVTARVAPYSTDGAESI